MDRVGVHDAWVMLKSLEFCSRTSAARSISTEIRGLAQPSCDIRTYMHAYVFYAA